METWCNLYCNVPCTLPYNMPCNLAHPPCLSLCVQPQVSEVTRLSEYSGMIVDACPILAFTKYEDKHHTSEGLAKWKQAALAAFQMEQCVGLATEDGASNRGNKKVRPSCVF